MTIIMSNCKNIAAIPYYLFMVGTVAPFVSLILGVVIKIGHHDYYDLMMISFFMFGLCSVSAATFAKVVNQRNAQAWIKSHGKKQFQLFTRLILFSCVFFIVSVFLMFAGLGGNHTAVDISTGVALLLAITMLIGVFKTSQVGLNSIKSEQPYPD